MIQHRVLKICNASTPSIFPRFRASDQKNVRKLPVPSSQKNSRLYLKIFERQKYEPEHSNFSDLL